MKSSEPLNVVANMVNNNRGAGMSIIQSAQLTRLVGNCVLCNGWTGVAVDRESRVELRGNGVYGNGCHGVCFRGDGLIVENDVVGNNSVGIRVMDNADVKVSLLQSLSHDCTWQYIEVDGVCITACQLILDNCFSRPVLILIIFVCLSTKKKFRIFNSCISTVLIINRLE